MKPCGNLQAYGHITSMYGQMTFCSCDSLIKLISSVIIIRTSLIWIQTVWCRGFENLVADNKVDELRL